MKLLFLAILACLSVGCSSQKNSTGQEKPVTNDTVKVIQVPIIEKRVAVKQNLSLVGAIIDSVELLDSLNYRFEVRLQTAISESGYESIVEPGQVLSLYPGFQLDENRRVDSNNVVNKKLIEMRMLKKKAFFIGKITLENDMMWYIVQVEAFQNAPEGGDNEF